MDNKTDYKKQYPLEEEIEDDYCDLDPKKICDNCGKCLGDNVNYKIVKITKIIKDENQ